MGGRIINIPLPMSAPMRPLIRTLIASAFIPALNAHAHLGDDATQVITPAHPVWLLEQPYADAPMLTARTFGASAYDGYSVKANLAISCHPQNLSAGIELEISPQSLGFDVAPFEGKGAAKDGPLRITTGTRASVDHSINGVWTHGGVFQVSTIFVLRGSVPRDELAYWASDASRGQSLTLSLAPAQEGGKPLTATFLLPANNTGLKKVIQPCLGTATP